MPCAAAPPAAALRRCAPRREPAGEAGGGDPRAALGEAYEEDVRELEALSESLAEQQRARGEALAERVDRLLGRQPLLADAGAAPALGSAEAEPSGAGAAVPAPAPELQRVVVCGVGGGSPGARAGQQLFATLRDAISVTAPREAPSWVDLGSAAEAPLEELDRVFVLARTCVICPDVTDDDRRTIASMRQGIKAVLGSFPQNLSKVVMLSRVGAQAVKGGINLRSMFGLGYEGTLTGLEDRRRRTLDVVIVRVGAPSRGLGAAVRCLPGDARSESPTSSETAAEALVQALVQRVSGSMCVVEEPGACEFAALPEPLRWRERTR
ncbi:unnamed protein product [Prorocentrum cordatum]|uniref:Uncharacterized protein n=1 Tax=Prorocentrum cordatum TaxID=2364126 RepID=A0ABN9SBX0_9DINO|nr:unnamed protein product [Polarella glacialis]